MMLRNLIDEVRDRRILAFAALGVLVALALPLLFLKSTPVGAPEANSAAPAPAAEAKLPERAARLLATTDLGTPGGRAQGAPQDPFNPPSSYRAAAAAAKSGPSGAPATAPAASTTSSEGSAKSGGGGSPSKPVEVVVTNPGTTPSTSTTTNDSTSTRPSTPARRLTVGNASIDIRFGPKSETPIKRAIPRQKAFHIHGKLVAMFVKYSPSRNAAVFALAPGLHITGPVKCRVVNRSCRYLDIPAGAHAWITTITANRTIVKRRLDVVRIKRRTARAADTKATSASARDEASCLARKLVAMELGDTLLDRDACKR